MAVGLSLLLGVRLPVNFNSPYKATSIIDFWRRWHMTLSRFLRDYLYVRARRQSPRRRCAATSILLLTMLLGGLWHGAAWTFVVWGGLHGLYLVVNHGWRHATEHVPGYRIAMENPILRRLGAVAATLLTLAAVIVAWTFFRAESVTHAVRVLAVMFGSGSSFASPTDAGLSSWAWIAAGFALALFSRNSQELIDGAFSRKLAAAGESGPARRCDGCVARNLGGDHRVDGVRGCVPRCHRVHLFQLLMKMRFAARVTLGLAAGFALSTLLLEAALWLLPTYNGVYAADPRRRLARAPFGAERELHVLDRLEFPQCAARQDQQHGLCCAVRLRAGQRGAVIFGDSYIEGLMNRYEDTLPAQLATSGGADLAPLLNFGISGSALPDYLGLGTLIRDRFRPTWIIVFIGDGDFVEGFDVRPGHFRWSPDDVASVELMPDQLRSPLVKFVRRSALVRYLRANLRLNMRSLFDSRPGTSRRARDDVLSRNALGTHGRRAREILCRAAAPRTRCAGGQNHLPERLRKAAPGDLCPRSKARIRGVPAVSR